MDAAIAQSLASGIDPTAIGALKAHPDDPAVRRAVAGQFGAMLMEGLMRNADGSALPMVDGVGSDTVNTLYANVMSQVAASSNQLGFADMLLQSMPKAVSPPAASGATPASPPPPASAPAAAPGAGFSLQQYWQGHHVVVSPGAAYAIRPPTTATRAGASASATPATLPSAAPPTSPSPYDAPASPAAQLAPSGNSTAADRQNFVATLAPLLQSAAQSLGVSPNVLLAQAALESGWGRSMPGNNLFGVKAGAGWDGDTVQAHTHEASANGAVGETAQFRAYPSLAAAVADYVQLIARNARYRAALGAGTDPLAYGQALVAGGYATDPDYASKLAVVAGSPTIAAALDTPAGTTVAQAAAAGGAA